MLPPIQDQALSSRAETLSLLILSVSGVSSNTPFFNCAWIRVGWLTVNVFLVPAVQQKDKEFYVEDTAHSFECPFVLLSLECR